MYMLLFIAIFFFCLLFFTGKEGLVTNIDQEVTMNVTTNDIITRVQLNCMVTSGDNWINIGDITIRDKQGNQVNYGNNPDDVYFGMKENWYKPWNKNLWDDSKTSFGHSGREVDNLIIQLGSGVPIGSIQITNRQDCCWHRIRNYRLSVYNSKNDEIGSVKLDSLDGQGKTVRYTLAYPKR
jgi:hypothetical protein